MVQRLQAMAPCCVQVTLRIRDEAMCTMRAKVFCRSC